MSIEETILLGWDNVPLGNWFQTFWDNTKISSLKFCLLMIPLHDSPSTIAFEQVVLKTITYHLDVNSRPGFDAKNACFGNSSLSGTTIPKAIVVFYVPSWLNKPFHIHGKAYVTSKYTCYFIDGHFLYKCIYSEICVQACRY